MVVVDVVVLVVVVVNVVVVVGVPQSWKQQEHDVETMPPICVQADALLTVAHWGGLGSWQVTPLVPHAVAASQLSSSDLHADVALL